MTFRPHQQSFRSFFPPFAPTMPNPTFELASPACMRTSLSTDYRTNRSEKRDFTEGEQTRKDKKKALGGNKASSVGGVLPKQFKPVEPKKKRPKRPLSPGSDGDNSASVSLLAADSADMFASTSVIPSSIDIAAFTSRRRSRVTTKNPVPGNSQWDDDYATATHGKRELM